MNKSLLLIAMSAALAACGGSDNDNDSTPSGPSAGFAETANQFVVDYTVDGAVNHRVETCYDIESNAKVDCAQSTIWDLRLTYAGIWLNGGLYGEGDGGAFGPQTLADLRSFEGGEQVPGFFNDSVGGTFLDNSWYGYNLNGAHKLLPNYRVYAIDNGDKQYKLRLTSFYAAQDSVSPAPGTSGVVTFEYKEITDGVMATSETVTLDASAGGFGAAADAPENKYTYFSFTTGAEVALSDTEAATSDAWDIAFKRSNIKLNSGVEAALAEAQADFYDADGSAIKDKFLAATSASEQAEFDGVDSSDLATLEFAADEEKSYITDWYNYDFRTHEFSLVADQNWVVRTAEGDHYAIVSVSDFTTTQGGLSSITLDIYPQVEAQ